MRWLWFVLSVACFAVAFRTHSMGLAALTLLGALGFLLMGTLALASSRIEARGRSEATMLGPDEARRMREQIERRKLEASGAASGAAAATGAAVAGGIDTPAAPAPRRGDSDVDDSAAADGFGDAGGGLAGGDAD